MRAGASIAVLPARGGRVGRGGFTLVELLVAIAIFVTVMASVALVFNGAIRTSKQGFQNQEAYELARGAMKIVERDLSRAFTNRNHGDVFNFYGTPIGFTYVGLISADESSAPNMARVTYVIRHLTPTLDNLAGAVASYDTKDGASIPTYQLLRYIEPGRDTLDSFPVDWTQQASLDTTLPTLNQIIDAAVTRAGCPDTDAACGELVRQAARRELWILMLSGGGFVDADADGISETEILSAWDGAGFAMPQFANLDPADYVVAESIRYINLQTVDFANNTWCAADQDALYTLLDGLGLQLDYDDVLYQDVNGQTCVQFVSSSQEPPVFSAETSALFSTGDGARPFFTYWDIGVRENREYIDPNTGVLVSDPDNLNTANDEVRQVAYQFWNDWRNMVADGLDNDLDGFVDEADERYAAAAGSPLDTRLPIAVTVDFTLFFRSPYPGAPDFNERFTQRIDLPTAYRRTFRPHVSDVSP